MNYKTDKEYFIIPFPSGNIIKIEKTFLNGQKTFLFKDFNGKVIYLVLVDNEFKVMQPTYGTLFSLPKVDKFFPRKFDHLFSYRYYIWSRTIPLILKHPWFGHGPQTFALFFPNWRREREKGPSGEKA